jgi:hypothetical protein
MLRRLGGLLLRLRGLLRRGANERGGQRNDSGDGENDVPGHESSLAVTDYGVSANSDAQRGLDAVG